MLPDLTMALSEAQGKGGITGLHHTVQVIIFLYLLEEETSYVVLFSSGLGLIIEFWKLTQAMSISLDWSAGYPKLKFADQKSYS